MIIIVCLEDRTKGWILGLTEFKTVQIRETHSFLSQTNLAPPR